MDDLTGKLMELLSNKENMEKIKGLGNIINAASGDTNEARPEQQNMQPNIESNGSLNENNDIIPIDAIQTVMKLMPLLSSINKEDDNTRLLHALRPHLSEKRRTKLDESMKMMQMFKLLPVLKSQGIF